MLSMKIEIEVRAHKMTVYQLIDFFYLRDEINDLQSTDNQKIHFN